MAHFWPTWNAGISQSSVYATAAPDLGVWLEIRRKYPELEIEIRNQKKKLGIGNKKEEEWEMNWDSEIRNQGLGSPIRNQKSEVRNKKS